MKKSLNLRNVTSKKDDASWHKEEKVLSHRSRWLLSVTFPITESHAFKWCDANCSAAKSLLHSLSSNWTRHVLIEERLHEWLKKRFWTWHVAKKGYRHYNTFSTWRPAFPLGPWMGFQFIARKFVHVILAIYFLLKTNYKWRLMIEQVPSPKDWIFHHRRSFRVTRDLWSLVTSDW